MDDHIKLHVTPEYWVILSWENIIICRGKERKLKKTYQIC